VRKILAGAAAIPMAMMMLAPTASAEGTEIAAERELDFAVRGTLPPGHELTCRAVQEPAPLEVCYEKNGDRWWVLDLRADGASALVYWFNYRGPGATPYREGFCVNSLGEGVWGQCNKDYYENSDLEGYGCTWDRDSGGIVDNARCNNDNWVFQ
jgi:hypothetical protein